MQIAATLHPLERGTIAMWAGLAALEDTAGLEDARRLQQQRARPHHEGSQLRQGRQGLPVARQLHALRLKVPGKTGEGMVKHAESKGLILRGQDKLYDSEGWFRLTVGTKEENDMFIAAVKEYFASSCAPSGISRSSQGVGAARTLSDSPICPNSTRGPFAPMGCRALQRPDQPVPLSALCRSCTIHLSLHTTPSASIPAHSLTHRPACFRHTEAPRPEGGRGASLPVGVITLSHAGYPPPHAVLLLGDILQPLIPAWIDHGLAGPAEPQIGVTLEVLVQRGDPGLGGAPHRLVDGRHRPHQLEGGEHLAASLRRSTPAEERCTNSSLKRWWWQKFARSKKMSPMPAYSQSRILISPISPAAPRPGSSG